MSRLKKSVLILMACLSFIVCQSLLATTTKPYTDVHKSILVNQGSPEFSISLASNPTTGYTWHAQQYDQHLLTVINHKYQPSTNSKLVGAGGIDVWTFKVKPEAFNAPHIMKIKMLYARPWDIKDTAKTLEFVVVTQ